MTIRILLASTLSCVLFSFSGFALADDQQQSQEGVEAQEQIYGSELMTKQERAEHREKMRAAKTEEERELIRQEHHERMLERAKARGLVLPDEPPARGMGLRGGGMGPGGSMGGGRGR